GRAASAACPPPVRPASAGPAACAASPPAAPRAARAPASCELRHSVPNPPRSAQSCEKPSEFADAAHAIARRGPLRRRRWQVTSDLSLAPHAVPRYSASLDREHPDRSLRGGEPSPSQRAPSPWLRPPDARATGRRGGPFARTRPADLLADRFGEDGRHGPRARRRAVGGPAADAT